MNGYIVAEDPVSEGIILRILEYSFPEFQVITKLPARGGQLLSKINEFNKLAATWPVILLADLDNNNCPPEMIDHLLCENKNDRFIFNIAIDEAEAWLMADRQGFSEYFEIDEKLIPHSQKIRLGGRKETREMVFPYKASLYFSMRMISLSRNNILIKQLTPKKGASKGPEYNSVMVPFIYSKWNIDLARNNSDSLNRMINRIEALRASALS